MEMARKSRKAKESRVGGKRYVTPAKAKVTKRKGTTTTYKPKPSPHLKPTAKKAAKKAAPKPAAKKAPKKSATDRKLKLQRLRNQMSEARGMSKLASGLTKDIGDAEFATDLAITAATLPIGGGLGRGALTGAKAIGRGAKATGQAVATGAKATGRAAVTGAKATGRVAKKAAKATGRAAKKAAKATKRGARIARVAAKKADRRLLKAQGLSRQGGKVRKIKEPNPFGAKAAKASKPKPKAKSDKKNPFADTSNVKPKPKAKARRAKKRETKAETKAEKRAREKTESLNVEKGYAQQRIDARKASRKRRRKS